MQKEWDKELKKLEEGKQPSLIKATIRAYGLRFCLNGLFTIVEECFIHVAQPILLGYLIQHFSRMKTLTPDLLIACTAGVCLLPCMLVFTHHSYYFRAYRMGMRLRIACCTMVYRKALKLSQTALRTTTVGQMVNLLSNDVNRFDQSIVNIPYLIVGPMQIIIIISVLWMYIGYASLAGVSVLLLYIPFQGYMGKLFSKLRIKTAALTDERIRFMTEIIGGMRVIKLYGWEIPFANLIDFSRRKEVKKIRQASILRGINLAVYYTSSKIILLITFVVFVLGIRGDLTPDKVFVCMSLFNYLLQSMVWYFPYAIAQGAESMISLKRIQKFLLLEEQSESFLLDASNLRPKLHQCGIWMNKVRAAWNKDAEATLRNVTLNVRPGELLAVVGPVGCGKTSLLMSILGELPITSGEVKVRGKVAYASQEAWVFGGSVRQNVVFGSDFDDAKYKEVLSVCALDKDIKMFPYGDKTAVGERGDSLSGGQKARVNLARAVYFDADIFLLDDPLSAVDSSVSKHLFEKCINGYLKDKVRILATHQVQFLKEASQILVLKEGGCLALGTYDQLTAAGVDLGSLMEDCEEERRHCLASTTSATTGISIIEEISDGATPVTAYESIQPINSSVDGYHKDEMHQGTTEKVPKMGEEIKSSGAIKWKIYAEYVKSGAGPVLRIILVFAFVTGQVLFNGIDFWLTGWTSREQLKYNMKQCWGGANVPFLNATGFYNDTYGLFNASFFRETVRNVSDDCFRITQNYLLEEVDVDLDYSLSIYAALVLSSFLLWFVCTTSFFQMCLKASITLHNKMFRSVLRSPVAFFDKNPIGNILNRSSRDLGIIDDLLPPTAANVLEETPWGLNHFKYSHCVQKPLLIPGYWMTFCTLMGIICVVAIVEPWLLLPTAIISIVFVFLRRFYLPVAQDIKRYEGITRSPLFSHLSTSLYGLTTIRAFKAQAPFEVAFDHYQDQHTATWFMFISLTRWFSIVLDWLCVAYIASVTIAMVMLSEDPSYASKAGLAIACSFQLSGDFQWGVTQSAEVESQMTSVERAIEYSRLPPEPALESDKGKKPPKNWPSKGYIQYKNVSLTYNKNERPVLKNLNFEIYPEEKIGIVGRTGAGKSSIIATLFRMTEPEGTVKIDGISNSEIGLHDLRKKISIIPQDPVLFTGPVRRNLDPFTEHKDAELWQALEEAHLKKAIEEMPGGLDTEVAEGGANFSVGQKQLMCLARAILRRNRILVLDEATANVDTNTDSLIQQTIRECFAHCTVLTISHRLHTIIDSDRVLVLDAGEIKEFDDPYTLLQDSNSLLSLMVQMTGPGMAKQLREIAHSAHMKNLVEKGKPVNVFGGAGDDDVTERNGTATMPAHIANGVRISVPEGHYNYGYEHTEMTYL